MILSLMLERLSREPAALAVAGAARLGGGGAGNVGLDVTAAVDDALAAALTFEALVGTRTVTRPAGARGISAACVDSTRFCFDRVAPSVKVGSSGMCEPVAADAGGRTTGGAGTSTSNSLDSYASSICTRSPSSSSSGSSTSGGEEVANSCSDAIARAPVESGKPSGTANGSSRVTLLCSRCCTSRLKSWSRVSNETPSCSSCTFRSICIDLHEQVINLI